jgi:TRAP-type mannitol/chloroaromatic compound transport system permease large subunit
MPFVPKIALTVRYVLPMLIIIFVIIGLMFLGLATPPRLPPWGPSRASS